MCFRLSEKLKDVSQFDLNDIKQIDSLLDLIKARGHHNRFHLRVYKNLAIPVNEKVLIKILDELSISGFLQKKFELCCPNCHETIEIYQERENIPIDCESVCLFCGFEFDITYKDLFETYKFVDNINLSPMRTKENFFNNGQITLPNSYNLPLVEQFNMYSRLMMYPEIEIGICVDSIREKLKESLKKVTVATDSDSKGKSLEEFTEMLFGCSEYLKCYKKNFENATGEIDIVFKVKKISNLFSNFSDLLIVECKNWKSPVGAKEIRTFVNKMDDFESNVGLIISKSGITGDVNYTADAKGVIGKAWSKYKRVIMVFDLNDLQSVVDGNRNLYELLEEKYLSVKLGSDS